MECKIKTELIYLFYIDKYTEVHDRNINVFKNEIENIIWCRMKELLKNI